MKISRLLGCTVLLCVLSSVAPRAYSASYDVLVKCTNHTCSPTQSGQLFSENYWAPGSVAEKIIRIKNDQHIPLTISIQANVISKQNIFQNVILTSIYESKSKHMLFSGNLNEFSTKHVNLGQIEGNTIKEYIIQVSMAEYATNKYQNMSTVFSLRLGFSGIPVYNNNKPHKPDHHINFKYWIDKIWKWKTTR